MITLRRVCLLLVVTLLAASVGLLMSWYVFLNSTLVSDPQGIKFPVHPGESYLSVSHDLYQANIIQHPVFFSLLIRMRRDVHHLKAGLYLFPKDSTPNSIIDQITTGKGLAYRKFIIIPGMTFKQIRATLNSMTEVQHTTQRLNDNEIMTRLGSGGLNPEGQFYPDTYFFVDGSSDMALLKRAFHTMTTRFMKAWDERDANCYFTDPYAALVAASIIEKEAKVREELPVIAGVMINRLKKNILLQFDPTVIYGIGDRYDGKIYKWDLTDNNPYNTYLHKGLPPTPISMPGKDAIHAILHPQQNDFLYFVANPDHRTHQFSRSLSEHYAAVNASRRWDDTVFVNHDLIKKYLVKYWQQNPQPSLPRDTMLIH